MSVPNILSVAGSDPSGGAGIQADLKSIAACGGYGMAAVTALTAQNTRGVTGVHVPPAAFLAEQLASVSSDVRIDAVKIGMLASAELIDTVAAWLRALRGGAPGDDAGAPVARDGTEAAGPGGRRGTGVVLDPVMVATSGDRLLDADAEAALHALLPLADVVTPNVPELAVLTGSAPAPTWDEVLDQAQRLAARHGVLVLAKGGHLAADGRCRDALVGADGVLLELDGVRVDTANTHGTGCSLSSALATLFARTGSWTDALRLAKPWLEGALRGADRLDVGGGHGPVDHLGALWAGQRPPSTDALLSTWWDGIAGLRAGIDRLAFIRGLKDGTLDRTDFEHYLAQDALYLRTYAQVLSRASELAPNPREQRFWAAGAHACLEEELVLHRTRLGGAELPAPTATTAAYLNHLTASGRGYPELVAAILPCYWLYQDVGSRLAGAAHPDHPYGDWLATYSSPEFDAATRDAIAIVELTAARARPDELAAMRYAFDESSRHELLFFAQTTADGDPGGAGAAFADTSRAVRAGAE
ncbi:PfkB family carbohydrate kinase [Zafaria sp. Z1313]|uniref:PfkB family carbohydrate kinase n=1 Tax=unclassified Zafaria TaxID=2828765 RepID=UPI002E79DD3E|nr:PfkB family carbohydrate kinase [Zafaria sp. J156]MEE1621434.1 PfkB family carbohydrate kinase [Zafaria sp. J156]